jgi:hypothetical protein
MHFHLGWPGPAGGFGHIGCHTGDDNYGGVSQRQTRQANRTVQNAKSEHPVPSKTTEALEHPHKQSVWGSKDPQRSGGSQDQEGPKSDTLANDDEAKHSTKKGTKEVALKQNKAQGEETEIRAEVVPSSQ